MSQKKKIILLVVATIAMMLIIVFLIGRSFGFFKYTKKGETTNIITINGIEVEIINPEIDSLNLENAYPVDDSDGMTYEPFIFTMTNTSSKALSYSIIVENDEDKQAECVIDENLICPELSTDYIRYSYKKDDGTYTEPRNLGSDNNVIASDVITEGETVTSSIILWIDSEAGNEIMNHYFFGKVIITGEQYITKNLSEAILNDNTLIEAEPTLTDSSNNTNDASGLYKSIATNDGSPTYYFRGNVENNYVDFAGFTWRIVRINEDGTIRLIMQDGINNNTGYTFNSVTSIKDNMYYSNSDIAKPTLEIWYQNNIVEKGYSDEVVTGNYFCEQAKVTTQNSNSTNSGTVMETYGNYKTNFMCSQDGNTKGIVNSNVGLITYDEVLHAGGYQGKENKNYYLYNSKNWWTMSPAGINNTTAYVWNTILANYITADSVIGISRLRPVINLKADSIVTGNGTVEKKYRIVESQ